MAQIDQNWRDRQNFAKVKRLQLWVKDLLIPRPPPYLPTTPFLASHLWFNKGSVVNGKLYLYRFSIVKYIKGKMIFKM